MPADAVGAGLAAAARAAPRPAPGSSFTPGISGAIRTPVGIPSRFSSATASIRFRGCGVCGSVALQAFSSRVGIERLATNSVRSESSLNQLDVAQQQRRLGQHRARVGVVAHRLPDPLHQPVAALDPLVGVGVGPERDVLALPRRPASSARTQLGHVDLDDDLALEVLARVQVEIGVRRAGEAVGKTHAWVQPRYGLIVQRNGIRDCFGTRLRPERACTSWKRMPSASGASKVRTTGSPDPRQQPCVLAPFSRFSQRTNTCSHIGGRADQPRASRRSALELELGGHDAQLQQPALADQPRDRRRRRSARRPSAAAGRWPTRSGRRRARRSRRRPGCRRARPGCRPPPRRPPPRARRRSRRGPAAAAAAARRRSPGRRGAPGPRRSARR